MEILKRGKKLDYYYTMKCPHCGCKEFKKETDIMDVWRLYRRIGNTFILPTVQKNVVFKYYLVQKT